RIRLRRHTVYLYVVRRFDDLETENKILEVVADLGHFAEVEGYNVLASRFEVLIGPELNGTCVQPIHFSLYVGVYGTQLSGVFLVGLLESVYLRCQSYANGASARHDAGGIAFHIFGESGIIGVYRV